MRFRLQGKPYEVDPERLSIAEAMQIKQATGLTVKAFLTGLKEYDVDSLVALVWLARSRDGERVSIQQVVASNFDLFDDLDLEKDEEDATEDEGGDGEQGPTGGPAAPPSGPAISSIPPSTPSTRTSTGRTGSARSR